MSLFSTTCQNIILLQSQAKCPQRKVHAGSVGSVLLWQLSGANNCKGEHEHKTFRSRNFGYLGYPIAARIPWMERYCESLACRFCENAAQGGPVQFSQQEWPFQPNLCRMCETFPLESTKYAMVWISHFPMLKCNVQSMLWPMLLNCKVIGLRNIMHRSWLQIFTP